MRIAKHLDYNLQAYQDRVSLVKLLDQMGYLRECPPGELEKVTNYLLYSEDVEAEVKLKKGSAKKISYETLIESATGEELIQNSREISIYKHYKPTIDREEDADIPCIQVLWEAIDDIEALYHYCRDVLAGTRELDPNIKTIPTYQNKYFYREWMIDLRREQYILKDSFKPKISIPPNFKGMYREADGIGMAIGPHILYESGETIVDFGNWKHIYNLLKYYSNMKTHTEGNPYSPWWEVYIFLDTLLDRAIWSPEHELILVRKIDKIPNEEIVRELENLGGRSYSINYISTIWKQSITKKIVRYAYLWWEEKQCKMDGTLKNMTKWRVCPKCGETLFAHDLNFGKYATGEWQETCKKCVLSAKLKKEGRKPYLKEGKINV
jgi:hypothetical protein